MKINEAAAAAEDRDRWSEILRAANPATLLVEEGTERRRRQRAVLATGSMMSALRRAWSWC